MKKIPFGKTSDGREASLYELKNGDLTVEILDYGAAVYSIRTPDREGKPVDVILAPATLEQFTNSYFDVICGRYANRIAGAKFTLNGKTYELAKNDGENHLHGGVDSFSRKVWEVKEYTDSALTLALFSPDGDEGYPGDLEVTVTYEVTADGGLELKYWAKSNADTVINLTNHAFFNLNGHDQGKMGELTLQIEAEEYIPTDAGSIPLDHFAPVEGTPFDFRTPKAVGRDIGADHEQLHFGNGYDQCFVVKGTPAGAYRGLPLSHCATLRSPLTGIRMDVVTTEEGLQLYTANGIGGDAGKDGATYECRGGLCLETACFPNAANRPDYPTAVLRAGEEYLQYTCYRFSAEK